MLMYGILVQYGVYLWSYLPDYMRCLTENLSLGTEGIKDLKYQKRIISPVTRVFANQVSTIPVTPTKA